MATTRDSQERKELEEFLRELVLHVEHPEDVDTLLGILKELEDANLRMAERQGSRANRRSAVPGRYDIFKMSPELIVRVGFVKGAENAKMIMVCLNTLGDGVYFLRRSDVA
jgi:hypothetical protein